MQKKDINVEWMLERNKRRKKMVLDWKIKAIVEYLLCISIRNDEDISSEFDEKNQRYEEIANLKTPHIIDRCLEAGV